MSTQEKRITGNFSLIHRISICLGMLVPAEGGGRKRRHARNSFAVCGPHVTVCGLLKEPVKYKNQGSFFFGMLHCQELLITVGGVGPNRAELGTFGIF